MQENKQKQGGITGAVQGAVSTVADALSRGPKNPFHAGTTWVLIAKSGFSITFVLGEGKEANATGYPLFVETEVPGSWGMDKENNLFLALGKFAATINSTELRFKSYRGMTMDGQTEVWIRRIDN